MERGALTEVMAVVPHRSWEREGPRGNYVHRGSGGVITGSGNASIHGSSNSIGDGAAGYFLVAVRIILLVAREKTREDIPGGREKKDSNFSCKRQKSYSNWLKLEKREG